MSGGVVSGCVSEALCCVLAPSVRLGRWIVGSCLDPEHEHHRHHSHHHRHDHHRRGHHRDCECHVPPPCWVPKRLDDVFERIKPGNTALVRLKLMNCGAKPQTFSVATNDPQVEITPATLMLGPLEEGVSVLSLTAAPDAPDGLITSIVVSVTGCARYNFRWTIKVACRCHRRGGCHDHCCHGCGCCREVQITERPDSIHHWYDHFYCERPCVHS